MEKIEPAGRSILRLSWLAAAVTAVAIMAFWMQSARERREAWKDAARAKVQDQADLLASGLQGVVDRNIRLVQGLVAVVSYEPGIDQRRFDALGARVLAGVGEVKLIAAAPDLVVRLVHPVQGNESAVGLDLRDYPKQLAAALMTRDLGVTVVSGPMRLVQGFDGFVVRSPVFINGGDGRERRFWGVISAVIDPTDLYQAAGLVAPDLGVDVALTLRGGSTAPFYGDAAILGQEPVTSLVTLPHSAWEVAVIPEGGWSEPPPAWGRRAAFALATLLATLGVFAAGRVAALRESELHRAREREAELSRLSWRLELALAASDVGVWDVDLATDQLLWDDRVRTLWSYPPRAGFFSEHDWAGRLHPDDRSRAVAEARAAADADGRFVSEYRIVRPDGDIRHIRDMASVYVAPDGKRRLVGLLWDVTADVERQEELNLRRMEAEAATVAKSRFLAAMSHEIRTPMSGVLGLLGLMLKEPLPPAQRERAQIALSSAQGLLQILNDILDFSKLEASLIRVTEEEVAIRPLMKEVTALMAAGLAQKPIELRCTVSDAVPEVVLADAMRLRQILTNLLSNATKFTEAGSIWIDADYIPDGAEGVLRIEVGDTGIGIAEEHSGKVFEQFVQIDNSLTRRTGGTGLGLSVSKQLVELMGGTIGVTSKPGEGSVFAFTVRVRPAIAATAEPVASPVEPEAARAEPLRVLLAEDNSTNQYLISAFLTAAGHTMVAVTNGVEAVEAVAAGDFDVVLMDVQMPLLDGLGATRAIRALPGARGRVPVVALTANAMSGDRELCMEAGMDDYLSKPIEAAALARALARVRDALDRSRASPRRSAAGG